MTRSLLPPALVVVLSALVSLAPGCGLQGRGQLCSITDDCDTAQGFVCNEKRVCCPANDMSRECDPMLGQNVTASSGAAGGDASSSSGSGAGGSGSQSSSATSASSSSSSASSSSASSSSSSNSSSGSGM